MKALAGLTAALILVGCAGATAPSAEPTPTVTTATTPVPTSAATPTTSVAPSVSLVPTASPSPSASPSALATTGTALSPAAVRYLLIDQLGPLHFCDPDEYPVAHGDEQQRAAAQFAQIQADGPTFTAITTRAGMAGKTTFSDADKLQIYREWKVLNGVDVEPLGSDQYSFDVTTEGDAASGQATHYQGTVDARTAQVNIAAQEEVFGTSCPICLARGTLIDTPAGLVAVDRLEVGDAIWTADAAGNRIESVVARVGSVSVPSSHQVVHLVLDDGRTVDVSPGHLLTDGRRVGELARGELYDGATVVSADRLDYTGGRTYDVLPAGETGFYWANGVLLASTLR